MFPVLELYWQETAASMPSYLLPLWEKVAGPERSEGAVG
jgi:hypothetical protein